MGCLHFIVKKDYPQFFGRLSLLIFIFTISLFGGCSSGGGGGTSGGPIDEESEIIDDPVSDSVSLVFNDGGLVTTNRVMENDPPNDFSIPYNYSVITAHYDAIGISHSGVWKTNAAGTVVVVDNDSIDYATNERMQLMLFFAGQSTGQYSYSNGTAQAMFVPDFYGYGHYISNGYQDAQVNINVTRYDPVDGRIQGSYDVKLCDGWAVTNGGVCEFPEYQLTFSGEFDVTRDADFAYANQGLASAPSPRLFDFNIWNNEFYSFVGLGESYYELQLVVPEPYQNQTNAFLIGAAQPSDEVAIYAYADSDFSQLLCSDASAGVTRKACQIETDQQFVYLKVVYAGAGMGAYYKIFSEGASTVYVGEGSVDNPVHFNILPVVHEGTVNSYANSFYTVDVTPGVAYDIQKFDKIAYRAELYVYDGGIAGDLLCNAGRYSDTEVCTVTPTANQLFMLVRGADTGFGTSYKISLAPAGHYVGEGSLTVPLDLGNAPVGYQGQIGNYMDSIYSVNVVAGTQYTLKISDFFGYGNVSVDSINLGAGYCGFGISRDTQSGKCTFTADVTGPLNIYIYGSGVYGTSFDLSFEETVYQSLGSVDQPVEYQWVSTSVYMPSIAGEVDTGSSYYSVLLPEDDDNFHFGVYLEAIHPNASYSIYDDANFSNLLCTEMATTALDLSPRTCAVNPSTNRMYIKVDGSQTQIGSEFTLRFNAPVFLSQGTETAPLLLGEPSIFTKGEVTGGSSSYYAITVQPGVNYEVKLNHYYGYAEMTIFEDAAMTQAVCPPGKETYGFDFSERCVVTPVGNQIYVKVDSISSSQGARFDFSVNEFDGDTYFIELVPNGIGSYAQPHVEIYTEDGVWVGYLNVNYNGYPSFTKILGSGVSYLIRVWDQLEIGGSYSINISRNGFGATSVGIPEIPDVYEPMDNTRDGATPLMLDEIQDHSFSFNNGDFGDEDWFIFTAP